MDELYNKISDNCLSNLFLKASNERDSMVTFSKSKIKKKTVENEL